MSEYHVEQCHALALSLCRSVVDATGHVVGHSRWQADAERIARALRVLDAMEQEQKLDESFAALVESETEGEP